MQYAPSATCEPLRVLNDLRDSEVEDLDREVPARFAEDEDIRRLDVAVRDPLAMGQRQRLRGGLEEPEGLLRRTRRKPGALLVLDDLLERSALEPLEDHVRHLATVGHPVRADVACLHDRGGALGEIGEETSLLDEALDELHPAIVREVAEGAEDLDRDRPVPDLVHRQVDEGEAALTDDAFDLVFVRDRRTDE